MRSLVGITVHVALKQGVFPAAEIWYSIGAQYARAIRAAGGVPVLLPTHPGYAAEPQALISRLDGLLLSGGGESREAHFANQARPSLRDTNPPRYDYELMLIRAARAVGLPILGICRGFQTLVEAEGGEPVVYLEPGLVQHDQAEPPNTPTHTLEWASDSWLGEILNRPMRVNSFHRQGVHRVPKGWRAVAWSADGLVEAAESDDRQVVGVQFHPEWLFEDEPSLLALFEWLVRAG
jgi:putative glutamine amidotransferase